MSDTEFVFQSSAHTSSAGPAAAAEVRVSRTPGERRKSGEWQAEDGRVLADDPPDAEGDDDGVASRIRGASAASSPGCAGAPKPC